MQAFGQITNDFFDDDASTNEVMVYINEVIDYTIHGRIEVYSLDGTLKDSFQATSALYLDASQGWDTYNRFIMSNEVIEEDGPKLHLYRYRVSGFLPVARGCFGASIQDSDRLAVLQRRAHTLTLMCLMENLTL